MRTWRLALVLAAVGAAVSLGAGSAPAPAREAIDAEDLRRHVAMLTSDEMEGRLVGTAGNRRAAELVAARFEALGLQPADDRGFLRRLDLVTAVLGDEQTLRVTRDGTSWSEELGVDFHPARHSGRGHAGGAVVFAGFGIVAPQLGHDDYRDLEVRGRVVVVLDHEPGEHDASSPFDGTDRSEHARAVRKAIEAQRRGAVAMLVAPDVHNHAAPDSVASSMDQVWPTQPPRVPAYQLGAWTDRVQIPVVRLSADAAERLLASPARALETLTDAAERPGGLASIESPDTEVEVTSTVLRRRVAVPNVVGVIRGVDQAVRDEWILVTAHLDHEGRTPRGIFRGADDDASGVAGVMEVAEAYTRAAADGRAARRSVLFAAWNAEERGLLGSWAYTEAPAVPLERTIAVLNMDMIGRHEEVPENGGARFRGLPPQRAEANRNAVNLLGYSYSPGLRDAATAANEEIGLELRFRYDDSASNLVRRSDQWPFLFHGVPALFVHTGLHPDYHTERDTPDKLDYDKMTRIVRLVHQLSWDLAQAETRAPTR